jgi:hypothetical protein
MGHASCEASPRLSLLRLCNLLVLADSLHRIDHPRGCLSKKYLHFLQNTNAGGEPRPMARATQEHRLLGIGSSAWSGAAWEWSLASRITPPSGNSQRTKSLPGIALWDRLPHKSSGLRPVRLAMRANIRGPISSLS